MRQLFFSGQLFFFLTVTVVFRGGCFACFEDFLLLCFLIMVCRLSVVFGTEIRNLKIPGRGATTGTELCLM